ncbi:diaminopimelate decarboxylase [Ligilactobacillus salitolerans]|uniref:Diaminopimelate decarboxylase n=1 Tax=Ligilactobacillus salitolerans TaxID=1808352 RepID=A0A401IUB2_9LACO|nr:diaminopimelate decarboxylase [Ligilactobacillus salitolerans]GBG95087.1 diaminopimelate decarboxylase [Ligilactobacillus salitolerans]
MPNKTEVHNNGQLKIGGVPALNLAEKYGTPLIAYDVSAIKQQIASFKKGLANYPAGGRIIYASKAFSALAMYRLAAKEDIGCDVVSGGELYAALAGGMDPEMIEFHGNNKLPEELEYAVKQKIGCIVVDNFHEIELLDKILAAHHTTAKVALRVAPGIEAETHKYIATGQSNSKFGFDLDSGQAQQALKALLDSPHFDVIGLHCHIGSQIFNAEGFEMAAVKMVKLMKRWSEEFGFSARILNLGGGFGIHYTESDQPLKPEIIVASLSQTVQTEIQKAGLELPELWVEPGRSLVGEAGTTLYTVGSTKKVPGLCNFVAVDGGMGDNIRPALYGAAYTALLAKDTNAPRNELATIVGKYCESGDVLVQAQMLPKFHADDILALLSTGAYGYSMASNYNRNGRPAVVFCEKAKDQLVIKRESYADMLRNEL